MEEVYDYPVSLSTFREKTNLSEMVRYCFQKKRPDDYKKFLEMPEYILKQERLFYKGFYKSKSSREKSPLNRFTIKKECSDQEKELLLSFRTRKNTEEDLCSRTENKEAFVPSYQLFCRCFKYEKIVEDILRAQADIPKNCDLENTEEWKNVSYEVYENFLLVPEKRKEYSLEMKVCPQSFKMGWIKFMQSEENVNLSYDCTTLSSKRRRQNKASLSEPQPKHSKTSIGTNKNLTTVHETKEAPAVQIGKISSRRKKRHLRRSTALVHTEGCEPKEDSESVLYTENQKRATTKKTCSFLTDSPKITCVSTNANANIADVDINPVNEVARYPVPFEIFLQNTNIMLLAAYHIKNLNVENPNIKDLYSSCQHLYEKFYSTSKINNDIFNDLYIGAQYADEILRKSIITPNKPVIQSVERTQFDVTNLLKGIRNLKIIIDQPVLEGLSKPTSSTLENNFSNDYNENQFKTTVKEFLKKFNLDFLEELKQTFYSTDTAKDVTNSIGHQRFVEVGTQTDDFLALNQTEISKESLNNSDQCFVGRIAEQSNEQTTKINTNHSENARAKSPIDRPVITNFQENSIQDINVMKLSDNNEQLLENENVLPSSNNFLGESVIVISSESTNATGSSSGSILRLYQEPLPYNAAHAMDMDISDHLTQIQSQSLLQPNYISEISQIPNSSQNFIVMPSTQVQSEALNNDMPVCEARLDPLNVAATSLSQTFSSPLETGTVQVKTEMKRYTTLNKLEFILNESERGFNVQPLPDEILVLNDSDEMNGPFCNSMNSALKLLLCDENSSTTFILNTTPAISNDHKASPLEEQMLETQGISQIIVDCSQNLEATPALVSNDKLNKVAKPKPSKQIEKEVPQILHKFRNLPLQQKGKKLNKK